MTHAANHDDLVAVLGHYALGETSTVQPVERGFVNDNWIVETNRGCYFVKRRHPDLRRSAVICAQHELIGWLRQAGFPAPAILPTLSGQTLLIRGGEFYEVQEYIEGVPYDHNRPAHLEEAALTLGRFHACVQHFSSQALGNLGPLYSPAILRSALADLITGWELDPDPELTSTVCRLGVHAEELAACFAQHGALPRLIIHGDYYAGNLLFDADRIVGVVDFDKARQQPRVVELAEALIYFSSPRPGHLQFVVYPGILEWERLVHFWHNYARVVALEEGEVQALPDYVRCIWLQMSLVRLLEKGPRPPEAFEALQEMLVLADWARANTWPMVEAGRSVRKRGDVA